MKRHELREATFLLLFLTRYYPKAELPEQRKLFLEGLEDGRLEELGFSALTEQDANYISEKLEGILQQIKQIDARLNEISEGWKTSRMGSADLNILRLAVFEMCFDEKIPVSVAINEAVELAKKYGQDTSASFINGLLGKIAKEMETN